MPVWYQDTLGVMNLALEFTEGTLSMEYVILFISFIFYSVTYRFIVNFSYSYLSAKSRKTYTAIKHHGDHSHTSDYLPT